MKKLPTTFITIVLIMAIMFLFIIKFMSKAESDIEKLEQKRKGGGANETERQINQLLN
ncbi:hypothetical protein KA977_09675 [Candidatus Dependentiae bacterium]|nr:hypothetical protein [Candidatus Dependentiae bacterium]